MCFICLIMQTYEEKPKPTNFMARSLMRLKYISQDFFFATPVKNRFFSNERGFARKERQNEASR